METWAVKPVNRISLIDKFVVRESDRVKPVLKTVERSKIKELSSVWMENSRFKMQRCALTFTDCTKAVKMLEYLKEIGKSNEDLKFIMILNWEQ